MANQRHFKLGPNASTFYDSPTRTQIYKNHAVSLPSKTVKASKRIQVAIAAGHIIEIQEAEALKLQAAHTKANKAPDKKGKTSRIKSPEEEIKDQELADDDDDDDDDDDSEDQDDTDDDDDEDDELEGLTKKELWAKIKELDPPASDTEIKELKDAKVAELKDFIRNHNEDNED